MANAFVEKLNGFARLGEEDVAALGAATANPRAYAPRQDLIREGDQPGPVFVMLEGWAFRYKILPRGTRQILAFLLPGDACDLHNSMLAEMDHSIQAVTPAKVALISRAAMDEMMETRAAIARAMYISQLVDEGILRSWIVSMGRRSSIERVAHLMCELYLRAAPVVDVEAGHVSLPLSQVVLADALGMTPVHINRVLKELRASGAMDIRRRSLVILDPVRLVQTAGFDDNYLHRRRQQRAKFH
jgi:CRP-like cAMP-binding protein